ncbi:MAG: hypothetical protein JSS96_04530 [Bacteroidetes bacterium]|nr:hypothetical protein [Bacteroidota bacterium]
MKHIFKAASLLLLTVFIYSLSSCKKEEDQGLPPKISFKTGANYISSDATVARDSSLTVGINASKSEGNDILTKLTITVSYDGRADSTIYTESVDASMASAYSKDFPVKTRNQAGTEKYTFSVVSKDGIVNSAKFTLTVK